MAYEARDTDGIYNSARGILQPYKNKVLLLIGLCAIATTGCQSTGPISTVHAPDPVASTRTACQKASAMWNDKIVPSRYDQLPPLTSPGIFDLLTLAPTNFSVKALTTEGDELEEGRHKLIHALGAEARMRLLISPEVAGDYTGIFHSGAECVIGRFSLATKPTSTKSIPGLALKIFIDGDQPSLNLLLMHSLDPQLGQNYFSETFSNILPPPDGLPGRLVANFFGRSAREFGAKDPNPGRLTLEHLAGKLPNGSRIPVPIAPYQLLYKPTAQARALMQEPNEKEDFRLKLASLPVGLVLYDIYTLAEGDSADNARILGQLVLASPVVASRYGDEKLYFQHHMERK
jgi:hypothetical protein